MDTTAAVCNVGSEELVALQASLTGFDFKVGDDPVPEGEILDTSMSKPRLAAGVCWEIPIKSIGSSIPEPGSYSGLLVVYGAGAGLIQREVEIVVESSEPEALKDPKGSLVFFNDGDLNLTWRELTGSLNSENETGVKVRVCNDGNGVLGSVEAEISDFKFLKNTESVQKNPLAVSPVTIEGMEKGVCKEFTLSANPEINPDSGKYEGFLSISTKNKDQTTTRIKRKVSIEIPSIESASAETISIKAIRTLPGKVILDSNNLMLKPELPGGPHFIPEEDTLLGYIENNGEYARVYVVKETDENVKGQTAEADENMNELPIRIEGLSKIGTYAGKIYLAGMDVGAGEINIQVMVSDHVFWAILAIVLGILLAFFIQLYLERWRISGKLKERTNVIQKNYESAKKDFPLKSFQVHFSEF